jgi:Tol biopolymer transport system component
VRGAEALIRSPRRGTLVAPRPTTSRIEERRVRFLLGTATSILVALVAATTAADASSLRLKAIHPYWLAGGARIAFLGWDGRRDQGDKLVRIWVMNADGRRRRALTRAVPNSPYELPVLSPSGRRFADVFDYGHKLVGWIGWLSGKTIWEKTLVRFAATYSLPSWSPDERAVAVEVESDPGGRGVILVEELKGSLHQISHVVSRDDSLAAWSPDSRRLAFVSCVHSSPSFRRSCDLVVTRRDGSERKVVARNVGQTGSPVWAPNGQTLAYSVGFGRVREAQWKDCSRCDPLELQRQTIYIVRPDGSGRRRVTTTSYLERDSAPALAWSPDNRRLAFTDGTHYAPELRDPLSIDVTIVGVTKSGGRRRVVRGGSQSAWSPDGRRLAVIDRRGVTIVDANDGTQRRLTSLRHVDDLAWAPSTRILFSRQGYVYTALPRTRPRRILP